MHNLTGFQAVSIFLGAPVNVCIQVPEVKGDFMRQTFRMSICALAIAVAGSGATPLLAAGAPYQQHDQDRKDDQHQDQNRDRDNNQQHDERAYYSNRNYQGGWKDGQRHKHTAKHFKNDADRQAYEAGYGHGDKGEQWQNPNRKNHDHQDH
jgi:hypothetical protein